MSDNDQLRQASDLIRARRYDEARALLSTLDHPTAREWLARLDQLDPPVASLGTDYSATDIGMGNAYGGPVVQRSKAPLFGLVLLLVTALLGGIGIGVVLYLSSTLIYLICFSVVLAGAVGGFVLQQAVRSGKVRSAAAAIFFGVLMGLTSYATYRYFEAQDIRAQLADQARQELGSAYSEAEIQEVIDVVLEQEYGAPGVLGILGLQAEEGVTIQPTRGGSTTGGTTLSKELTIGYWLLEIVLICTIPLFMAQDTIGQPFCDDTNAWLRFETLGKVPTMDMEAFLGKLSQGDFAGAQGMISRDKLPQPYLEVRAGRCHDQSPQAMLYLRVMNGRNSKDVLKASISAAQYTALLPPGRL